jgi:hypothetical protein
MNNFANLLIILILSLAQSCSKRISVSISEGRVFQVIAPPSLIQLVNPVSSPSNNPTPTFRVLGVESGQTVSLLASYDCSGPPVAQGVATSTEILLTASTLPPGQHTFYARNSSSPNLSACSTTFSQYEVSSSFTGIDSIDQVTDISARVNWSPSPDATSYDIVRVVPLPVTTLVNVPGQSTSSYLLQGLAPGTTYEFRVNSRDNLNQLDSNNKTVQVTLASNPLIPSGLIRINPTDLVSSDTSPVIGIQNTLPGYTVNLYSDSACSPGGLLATGTAVGTSFQLNPSPALSFGYFTFYAQSENSAGNLSECSSDFVNYELISPFSGLTGHDQVKDTSARLTWTANPYAVSYRLYRIVGGIPVLFQTITDPLQASIDLGGLTPDTTYQFRLKLVTANGNEDTNLSDRTFTTNLNPDAPDSPVNSFPGTPISTITAAQFQVTGVKSGDIISLHANNCTETALASGISPGTSITLTTSLSPSTASYLLFARATNSSGGWSCSLAGTRYTVFNGLSSVSSSGDVLFNLNWDGVGSVATNYLIYDATDPMNLELLSTLSLSCTSCSTNIESIIGGVYQYVANRPFIVRLQIGADIDQNTNIQTGSLNNNPPLDWVANNTNESLFYVLNRVRPQHIIVTARTLDRSRLHPGTTVELYLNESCTGLPATSGVASDIPLQAEGHLGVDLSLIDLVPGIHVMSLRTVSPNGQASPCSNSKISYCLGNNCFSPMNAAGESSNGWLGAQHHLALIDDKLYHRNRITDASTTYTLATPLLSGPRVIKKFGTTLFVDSISGTNEGLGYSTNDFATVNYRTTLDGLPSNVVNDFDQCDGRMYVATPLGLAISSDNGVTFSTASSGLPSQEILAVACLGGGRVLAGRPSPHFVSISNDFGATFSPVAAPSGASTRVSRFRVFGNEVAALDLTFIFPGVHSTRGSFSFNGGASFTAMQGNFGTFDIVKLGSLYYSRASWINNNLRPLAEYVASSDGFTTDLQYLGPLLASALPNHRYGNMNTSSPNMVAGDHVIYYGLNSGFGGLFANVICPSNYIRVSYDKKMFDPPIMKDFCVAKFEMKDVSGTPTSQASGLPWLVTRPQAKSHCQSLGPKYDLISNQEWMTIARDIELTKENWSSGTVGVGMVNRGHSDNIPPNVLSIIDTNDSYDQTLDSIMSNGEQKRTHTLSNGEVIWDFSGNSWEWVDFERGGVLDAPPSCPGASEINDVVCAAYTGTPRYYQPENMGSLTPNSSFGLGYFIGHSPASTLARGGDFRSNIQSGIYTMNLLDPGTAGFRCVLRP